MMQQPEIAEYIEKGGLITIVKSQEKRNAWTKKKRKPKLIKRSSIYIDQEILNRFDCSRCTARSSCTAICPPIAWMVQQVEYEPPKETQIEREPIVIKPFQQFTPGPAGIEWPQNDSTSVTIIKKYFTLRQTPKEIAKDLNISIQYVYREIKKSKRILKENLTEKV